MSKPSTADGYSPSQTAYVRATCVYVATKLGDLMDEVVVVGGLVPYLLVDQEDLPAGSDAHAGTMDLDMGLALAILNGERYRDLGNRLRDAGFEASVNEAGNRTSQTWIAPGPPRVKVDFLIPPVENAPVSKQGRAEGCVRSLLRMEGSGSPRGCRVSGRAQGQSLRQGCPVGHRTRLLRSRWARTR